MDLYLGSPRWTETQLPTLRRFKHDVAHSSVQDRPDEAGVLRPHSQTQAGVPVLPGDADEAVQQAAALWFDDRGRGIDAAENGGRKDNENDHQDHLRHGSQGSQEDPGECRAAERRIHRAFQQTRRGNGRGGSWSGRLLSPGPRTMGVDVVSSEICSARSASWAPCGGGVGGNQLREVSRQGRGGGRE